MFSGSVWEGDRQSQLLHPWVSEHQLGSCPQPVPSHVFSVFFSFSCLIALAGLAVPFQCSRPVCRRAQLSGLGSKPFPNLSSSPSALHSAPWAHVQASLQTFAQGVLSLSLRGCATLWPWLKVTPASWHTACPTAVYKAQRVHITWPPGSGPGMERGDPHRCLTW